MKTLDYNFQVAKYYETSFKINFWYATCFINTCVYFFLQATLETVDHPQVEEKTVIENGDIIKHVHVRFTNSVRYFNHHCNLMNIFNSQDLCIVEGVAEIVKKKGRKDAYVRCIKNVDLQKLGLCTFQSWT